MLNFFCLFKKVRRDMGQYGDHTKKGNKATTAASYEANAPLVF